MTHEPARWYRGRMIFGPFLPVLPAEVQAIETEIDRPLPAAYRSFIDVANGGRLPYAVHVPPTDGGEVVQFEDLYKVGRNAQGEHSWGTLIGQYRQQFHWWFADEMSLTALLPIARTGGEDDTLFLDLRPETYGQVLAFVSGLPPAWGRRTENLFGVLAPSFDDYLDALFVDPGLAEVMWQDANRGEPDESWRRVVELWLDSGLPEWRTLNWASPGTGRV